MTVVERWKAAWTFKPGDPANKLHPRKYDLLFAFEDRHWWFLGMRRIQHALIPELAARANDPAFRVLDAGCGTGGRLAALKIAGLRVGMDLSPRALGYAAQRRLPHLAQGSIEQLPFASESFDVVMSWDVINLLDDETTALREMSRVCKPGGVLFLNLAAFDFLGGTHSEAVGMVRRYTASSLRARLVQAGLTADRITYTNALLFPLIALARLWSLILPTNEQRATGGYDFQRYPAPLNWLLAQVLALESALLRACDMPFGSSVVARVVKAS